MKRIVILCDGTWNKSDSETPTNVVQLAQALETIGPDGIVQVPIYIRGVGTGAGVTWFSRMADTTLGGAFGWGLLENIEEAYRHLVFLYEPRDEIFVFGFSRGAYTARSLVGFMRSTGLVERGSMHRIPEALARYRTLDDERTHPNSEESHRFRSGLSPRVVTSDREAEWRRQEGLPAGELLRIAFLGLWDTVGALGVPGHIPVLGEWARRRYRFHDARLSSMVRMARHAVALDETRQSFTPTRWENVAELNAESPNPSARPYREFFFAGDSWVGGRGWRHPGPVMHCAVLDNRRGAGRGPFLRHQVPGGDPHPRGSDGAAPKLHSTAAGLCELGDAAQTEGPAGPPQLRALSTAEPRGSARPDRRALLAVNRYRSTAGGGPGRRAVAQY